MHGAYQEKEFFLATMTRVVVKEKDRRSGITKNFPVLQFHSCLFSFPCDRGASTFFASSAESHADTAEIFDCEKCKDFQAFQRRFLYQLQNDLMTLRIRKTGQQHTSFSLDKPKMREKHIE